MSSSTMIHGASIRTAKTKRTTTETATIAVSHAQTGTARTSERAGAPVSALTAKADLAERVGDAVGVVELDLGGALGDLAQERLAHGRAARGLLECRDVEVGDVAEL